MRMFTRVVLAAAVVWIASPLLAVVSNGSVEPLFVRALAQVPLVIAGSTHPPARAARARNRGTEQRDGPSLLVFDRKPALA